MLRSQSEFIGKEVKMDRKEMIHSACQRTPEAIHRRETLMTNAFFKGCPISPVTSQKIKISRGIHKTIR